jgi:hypothetical protein
MAKLLLTRLLMKQRYLLSLLLLTSFLAHADPLNNGALGALGLLVLLLLGFVGLTLLLVVLAFLRPASQLLQLTQGAFLLVFSWLYLSWFRDLARLMEDSPYPSLSSAVIPLALLLNGLTQAKQAQRHLVCQAWAGLAVAGSGGLLKLLVRVLELKTFWLSGPKDDGLYLVWRDAVAFLVTALSWVLVLTLLRRQPAPAASLWQSWWSTPAIGAGMSAVFYLLNLLDLSYGEPGILSVFMACWLAGVIVLRLIHPLSQRQEVAGE